MAQDGSTFRTHRNHKLPYYPKEPLIFSYIRQCHSTPSHINNPDTDSCEDKSYKSSEHNHDISLELSNSNTSSKTAPQYQRFPTSPHNFQTHLTQIMNRSSIQCITLPLLTHQLDNLTKLLPLPRFADSPEFNLEVRNESQTQTTHIRDPHSPYTLCPLPPNTLCISTLYLFLSLI